MSCVELGFAFFTQRSILFKRCHFLMIFFISSKEVSFFNFHLFVCMFISSFSYLHVIEHSLMKRFEHVYVFDHRHHISLILSFNFHYFFISPALRSPPLCGVACCGRGQTSLDVFVSPSRHPHFVHTLSCLSCLSCLFVYD